MEVRFSSVPALRVGVASVDTRLKGQVLVRYALQGAANGAGGGAGGGGAGAILKLTLRDSTAGVQQGSGDIDVFFRGHYAKQLDFLRAKDTVILSGFLVEKSPGVDPDHPVQVVVAQAHKSEVSVYSDSLTEHFVVTADDADEPARAAPKRKATDPVDLARTKRPKRQPTAYKYVQTQDLDAHRGRGTDVNLYGVVIFFKPARKSRGTDHICSVILQDSTWAGSMDGGVPVNMFNRDGSKLPQTLQPGDILRVHRMKLNSFQGGVQGVTNRTSSWLSFSGTPGAPLTPTESRGNYTFTEDDKKRVRDLRAWADQRNALPMRCIEDSGPGSTFELQCKIMFVSPPTELPVLTVGLLDGTVPPPKCRILPAAFRVDCPTEARARVVELAAWDDVKDQLSSVKIGELVKFTGVTCRWEQQRECWKLHCGRGSLLEILGRADSQDLRGRLDALLGPSGDRARRATSSVGSAAVASEPAGRRSWAPEHRVTKVQRDLPISTIAHIRKTKPPRKFRCHVRVAQVIPADPRNLTKAVCAKCRSTFITTELDSRAAINTSSYPCPLCERNGDDLAPVLEFQYLFALRVQDDSSADPLTIIVCQEDANMFFSSIPPCDLHSNNASLDLIKLRLDALLQADAWMDCCLKSYSHCRDAKVPRYRICDTFGPQ